MTSVLGMVGCSWLQRWFNLSVLCKSGNHAWTNMADAEKCCNGFVRQLRIYPEASEVDDLYGWYGYVWVPVTV